MMTYTYTPIYIPHKNLFSFLPIYLAIMCKSISSQDFIIIFKHLLKGIYILKTRVLKVAINILKRVTLKLKDVKCAIINFENCYFPKQNNGKKVFSSVIH